MLNLFIIGNLLHGSYIQGLKLVLNEIFLYLKLHRIEAKIQPNNLKSINLVKANKFAREGYSKNYLQVDRVWRDHERWALTYEHWIKSSLLQHSGLDPMVALAFFNRFFVKRFIFRVES